MAEPEAGVSNTRKKWRHDLVLAMVLLGVLLICYSPALHGGFLWDDDTHISDNWTLRTMRGLRAIWLIPAASCQYYPLTFTGFWTGYQLWGLNTLGYHLVNVCLHAATAILLWQLLERLRVRGALLAGAIFALHPVSVMSVAWMTEFKNTFSATLALCAAWAYLRFAGVGVYESRTGSKPRNAWGFYLLSLSFFLLAMFAKTAVSFLPLTLFLIVWWQKKGAKWSYLLPLIPMVLIAAAMGVFTIHFETHAVGASGGDFSLSFPQRLLVSGQSFWFYLGKLFLPWNLSFIYGRWDVDAGKWSAWISPVATFGLLGGLWVGRKWIGRGPFVAMMHFYVSTSALVLAVVLYMMRYTFVSDHWQYFGSMSVIALVAAGIAGAMEKLGWWNKPMVRRVALALLAVLGGLTWWQCRMYKDNITLWQTTIVKSPGSWMAHDSLGNALRLAKRPGEAIPEHWKAIALKPDSSESYSNLANAYLVNDQLEEAITNYRKSLEIDALNPTTQYNLGNALLHYQGNADEAIPHLEKSIELEREMGVWPGNAFAYFDLGLAFVQRGEMKKAVSYYEKAIAITPDLMPALNNLAWIEATSPDPSLRNGKRAVELAEELNRLTQNQMPDHLQTLAAAYAENGDFAKAVETAQRALAIVVLKSDSKTAEKIQGSIDTYKVGQPYRDTGGGR